VGTDLVIRPAEPEDRDAVLDVILAANPHLYARVDRFRSLGAPWCDATAVVCDADGRIASTAVIFGRSIWTRRGAGRVGGIGAVATRPEMRGRGFASATLAKCESILRSEGFQAAMLFCTIVPFFERLGWNLVPEPPLPAIITGRTDDPIQIRKVDLEADWRMLSHFYDRVKTGAVLRNEELWHEYVSWVREDLDLLFGALCGNDLVAYVRGRGSPEGLELLEATAVPEFTAAIAPLVEAQLATLGSTIVAAPPSRMMMKNLQPEMHAPQVDMVWLDPDTLVDDVPWQPRVWWPVDRF
jgi:GNAT superfamily N-acetyltransferase